MICYYRCREANRRKETCPNNKSIRSDKAHPEVWDLVSGLLSEPERLRRGLDAMIEEQRGSLRGDPEGEARTWLERLAALDLSGAATSTWPPKGSWIETSCEPSWRSCRRTVSRLSGR